MTGNELAAHLESLAALMRLQGERRINGLTFDVCEGIELAVPSAAAERQRKRRKGGGGNGPPSVTPDASPALHERDVGRDKNESESVTDQEAAPPSLVPPLHSPLLPTPGISALSSSSKTFQVGREEDDDGGSEQRFTSVTEDGRVPCPGDLELLADQRASLLTSMVPAVHIDAIVRGFRAKYAGDASDKRTLAVWRRCAVQSVNNAWNNPRTRVLAAPDDAPARRLPPVIQRDYTPPPLEDIPAEILARMSPPRPLLKPVKSSEQQLAELRAIDPDAFESEAADG